MFRKHSWFVATVLLFGSALASADSRRQVLMPGDLGPAPAHRLWAWNLGMDSADILVESNIAVKVRVEPGEAAEVSELLRAEGPAMVADDAAVLMLAASRDFDPGALEIDGEARVQLEKVGRRLRVKVQRPAWASSLLAMANGEDQLGEGQTVEVLAEAGPDGRVRLAAGLEKGSAVTLTVNDEQGAFVKSFSVASSAPVRWQIDLGAAEELGSARLALHVNRGHAVAGVPLAPGSSGEGLRPLSAKLIVCTGAPSRNVIYGGSYTYSVSGCPANTCGELDIQRNGGSLEQTPGWICTDGSGNATKGPWNWSDKPSDETGDPIYITWPGGNTTNTNFIIVDKHCAQTYRDSPDGAPPTFFSGHATDAQWGAGFDFGGTCTCYFQDNGVTTTQTASKTRVDRWNVNWVCVPPSTISGHQYSWYACCHDGGCGVCTTPLNFTKP